MIAGKPKGPFGGDGGCTHVGRRYFPYELPAAALNLERPAAWGLDGTRAPPRSHDRVAGSLWGHYGGSGRFRTARFTCGSIPAKALGLGSVFTLSKRDGAMTKFSSKTQFRMGTGLILFMFCLSVSLVVYRVGKEEAEQRVFMETEIYIAAVDATRTYVKDVLRPRMYDLIPEDDFVVEAMSTSFVGREVMHRVNDRLRSFHYKRAALIPINPESRADALEADFIERFNADPNLREWSGLIEKNGRNYYARLRAIYAERECLRCHGDPDDIPQPIVDLYGSNPARKAYDLGQVVGADIVYIPVDVTFGRIKRLAWVAFVIGAGCLCCLVVLFYTLFNHTVISELKGLLETFKGIAAPPKELERLNPRPSGQTDEFEQLKTAFEEAATDWSSLA
jgi:two-component system, NtrC family, sensor kinase